ncbi:MAG: thioredoxin fold domain-containing protein [Caldimonas sp.]
MSRRRMRLFARLAPIAAVTVAALAGCSRAGEPVPVPAAPAADVAVSPAAVAPLLVSTTASGTAPGPHAAAEAGIAWHHAATDAEVDAAFAVAKAGGRPVFVYWGAGWCPPCNQVKATLFNRQDFIERTRAFVAVYVDGDSPGAQKLGARFHVSGYPTMVLFSPSGQEVTRLPGEVDPVRYTQVMTLAMNAARPVKELVADALAGRKLTAADWRLLAFYAWETDEQQVVAKDRVASTLSALAAAAPAPESEVAMRLRLRALALSDGRRPAHAARRAAAEVERLLAEPAAAREQADLLSGYAAEIVRSLAAPKSAERGRLLVAFDTVLRRLEADATLSRADRMQALIAQVDLARIDDPDDAAPSPRRARHASVRLPPALLADIREQVARADREITNGYERQAVITSAAYLLERAGLVHESDALLKANLAKSHSPYYLMLELASNAKKRGDRAEALDWYRQAFEASEGPATRLQWGAGYVKALVELAPANEAAIEAAASTLWQEATAQPDAFYERSARSLQRVGKSLQTWNRGGAHAAPMARLEKRLDALCAAGERSGAERDACRGLLRPIAKKSSPARAAA